MAEANDTLFTNFINLFRPDRSTQDETAQAPAVAAVGPGTLQPQYHPSDVQEALEAKAVLHSTLPLPLELVEEILEFAEYWPRSTVITPDGSGNPANRPEPHIKASDWVVLRSLPLCYSPGWDPSSWIQQPEYKNLNTTINAPTPELTSRLLPDRTAATYREWCKTTLPKGSHPCRKIVFTIRSTDQGWGGRSVDKGTFVGSYTWFDVGLEKYVAVSYESRPRPDDSAAATPAAAAAVTSMDSANNKPSVTIGPPYKFDFLTIDPPMKPPSDEQRENKRGGNEMNIALLDHPALPPPTRLQSNRTATKETEEYVIEWSYRDNVNPDSSAGDLLEEQGRGRASMTGEFVRKLEVGDVVTVWARERFPGWRCKPESVRIDVYWAV